jgi:hypothetical protein
MPSSAAWAPCSATARSCRTAAATISFPTRPTSSAGASRAPRRLRLPGARRRGPRPVSRPEGNGQGAARRPRHGAHRRHGPPRPARRARSSRCWSAPTTRRRPRAQRARRDCSWWPRTGASARTSCWPRWQAQGGGRAGGGGRDHRAALEAFPADRQGGRGARQLRRSRHGDRDCPAQARVALRVLEGRRWPKRSCPTRCARATGNGKGRTRTSVTCRW